MKRDESSLTEQNATLAHALDLWADWMRNDFAELRPLWYPAESMVVEVRQSVTESSSNDDDNNINHRIALEVNNCIINLTPAQRAAIERSLGLCSVVRIWDYEQQLLDAQGRIWRHLLSRGCM